MNEELNKAVDEAQNRQWAEYYAARMVRYNTQMNQDYGLKLSTDHNEFYQQYLNLLNKKDSK